MAKVTTLVGSGVPVVVSCQRARQRDRLAVDRGGGARVGQRARVGGHRERCSVELFEPNGVDVDESPANDAVSVYVLEGSARP